ncbi:hypothetical protein [Acaryochloris thomasi]|uniref:hypothetical protein n=1 Tax=Acaryochloris thomasi TaxID=2929456 RepID=UPI000DA6615A|nr:hypothetical protein [Acaryochloris thomasi]
MAHIQSHSSNQKQVKTSEAVWPHLRRVISKSSGFKHWVLEHGLDSNAKDNALDTLVHSYLRQTLETLAY